VDKKQKAIEELKAKMKIERARLDPAVLARAQALAQKSHEAKMKAAAKSPLPRGEGQGEGKDTVPPHSEGMVPYDKISAFQAVKLFLEALQKTKH
jgi:hypothetical protein